MLRNVFVPSVRVFLSIVVLGSEVKLILLGLSQQKSSLFCHSPGVSIPIRMYNFTERCITRDF